MHAMSTMSTMKVSTARGGALGAKRAVSSARALRARVDMSAATSFTRDRAAVVASATKRATSYAHTNRKGLAAFVERASTKQMKGDLIPFRVGMTLKVGVTVAEGNKTRVQPYEGVVIAIHRAGVATTVTVRKTMQGFGVERVFPVHSPLCTFEEVRGAGKPVVRNFVSSMLDRDDGSDEARVRGVGRRATRDARPSVERRRRSRAMSPPRAIETIARSRHRLVVFSISQTDDARASSFLAPITGSSRQALLPAQARREASETQDSLRRQEGPGEEVSAMRRRVGSSSRIVASSRHLIHRTSSFNRPAPPSRREFGAKPNVNVPPHASTPHAWTMTVTLRSSDDETFVVDDDVALCVARRPRTRRASRDASIARFL